MAAVALVLLAPFLGVIALLLWITQGPPILYRQVRIGQGGKPFVLYKFRTMRSGAEREGPKITVAGDPRITPIGRFLRRYKLDELPQLFNVLKGDMVLVGPRPEVPEYIALLSEEEKAILEVPPGITDPTTVWLRNEEEVLRQHPDPERYYREVLLKEKIRRSLEYQRQRTFFTDLMVLWRTFLALFR